MAKLTLTDFSSLSNETSAVATLNSNNTAIETALENTLSRDGTSPNSMGAQLDMNSNKIINLTAGSATGEAVAYQQLSALLTDISDAQAAAEAAQLAAENAQTAAETAKSDAQAAQVLAETAQAAAETALDSFDDIYLGAKAVAPTLDNDGNPLDAGDLYYDTVVGTLYVYNGSGWVAHGLSNTVETLTNKTINLTSNTITGTTAQFNTALSDGDFSTLAGTETLTNKTINLTSNTITGTAAQFNTACSDADLINTLGGQTINGNLTLSDTASFKPQILVTNNANDIYGPYLNFGKTRASGPAIAGDSAGTFIGRFADSGSVLRNSVWFSFVAQTINAGSVDGYIGFTTTQSGSTVQRMVLQNGLRVGSPTGSDKGAGTINVSAGYYVNDVQVPSISGAATLTNKTINLSSNTLSTTLAQLNTAISDADLVSAATISSRAFYVDDYGAVGDGVTVDTTAIQNTINAAEAAGGGIVVFTQGKDYKAGSLTLDNKYVTFWGFGAKLTDATITVAYPVASGFIVAASFYGLNFVSSSTPHVPIILRRGYDITIQNCRFTNNSKAIHFNSQASDFDVNYHCVGGVTISNNFFDFVDYAMYITRDAGLAAEVGFQEWLVAGDVTFTENQIRVARTTHVWMSNIDGFVCANNTMFHYGSDGVTTTKERCIEVTTYGSQLAINNNQFFESGLEAIKLNNCRLFRITGNNFVQCGQVNLSSSIYITNASAQTTYGSIITSNTIYQPTKYGIEINNSTYMVINDNHVENSTSDPAHYYGDTALGNPSPTTVTHYALSLSSSNNVTGENYDTGDLVINTSGTVRKPGHQIAKASSSANLTTLPAQFDQLNLSNSNTTTVTAIDTGYEGQILTIITSNGNTTISHVTGIRLAAGVNWTMPSEAVLVLKYTGTKWVEIGRTAITTGLVPYSRQIFTSSGTWTKPTGCKYIKVTTIGGGGAGGGAVASASNFDAGAGGGAGGTAIEWIDASALTTETVTIGAGGTGVSGAAGNAGGNSSFGSHHTANGGSGGQRLGGGTTVAGARGAAGGTASNADQNISGQPGTLCQRFSGTSGISGIGGHTIYGAAGQALGNTEGAGNAGTGRGAGGSGATSSTTNSFAGAYGRDGLCIVEEFYYL